MTYFGQAIQDAVEKGGYKNPSAINYLNTKRYGNAAWRIDAEHELLLDPKWWQALGKARVQDWGETTFYGFGGSDTKPTWIVMWHRLIDHLAAHNDIESFFKTL